MRISDMQVVHRLKQGPAESVSSDMPCLFHLDTCQRQLWIMDRQPHAAAPELDTYVGEAAYVMLLSIACGLESRVIGETEVFAQLKSAWRDCRKSPETDALLTTLFEDTKFIRTNYLSGIGGQSYGTLIRKFVAPAGDSHFLIAGAGDLACAIAPLLTNWRLTLMNRTFDKACKLAGSLAARGAEVDAVDALSADLAATDIIVCRPLDLALDQQLVRLPTLRNFVHLGASRRDLAALSIECDIKVLGLDDIFALQAAQDDLRAAHVARARRACRERAKLRCLGASVTLPHGWEDLAAFGQS